MDRPWWMWVLLIRPNQEFILSLLAYAHPQGPNDTLAWLARLFTSARTQIRTSLWAHKIGFCLPSQSILIPSRIYIPHLATITSIPEHQKHRGGQYRSLNAEISRPGFYWLGVSKNHLQNKNGFFEDTKTCFWTTVSFNPIPRRMTQPDKNEPSRLSFAVITLV